MSWVSGIVVYVLAWWVILFAVLPWGAGAAENQESGHGTGAPAMPRLRIKFLITSSIAFVAWLLIYALIKADIVDFRSVAEQMTQDDLR